MADKSALKSPSTDSMELATSTPNNLVSSSSFSPSSTRIVRLRDHLKQSDPENVQLDSMFQSEPSASQSEMLATILISDGTKCYVKVMAHKKHHSTKSQDRNFCRLSLRSTTLL